MRDGDSRQAKARRASAWTGRSASALSDTEDRDTAAPCGTCQGHMVGRIIAAFRRGGRDCCVVLTEGETLH